MSKIEEGKIANPPVDDWHAHFRRLRKVVVNLWLRYLAALDAKPLKTKTITAAVCGVISEYFVSKIANDGRSLVQGCTKQIVLSFVFRGPVMHYWTTFLNGYVTKPKCSDPKMERIEGLKMVLKKVAIHEAVYDPFFVICFLFLLRLWDSRGDIGGSFQGARANFRQALTTQYSIWPAVQLINYGFVPARLQVGFISAVAICTNAYLTYLSKKRVK